MTPPRTRDGSIEQACFLYGESRYDPTPDRKARRGFYPRCVPIVPDSSTWHLFFLGVAPVAAPGPTTRHHRWATKSSIYLRGILPPGWSCGLGGNERAVHQRRPPRLSASILRCCGSILTNLGGMNRASGRGTERPGAFALAPGGDSGAVPTSMAVRAGNWKGHSKRTSVLPRLPSISYPSLVFSNGLIDAGLSRCWHASEPA
jgi:hypothetical protein